ncbi:MAG: exodeoxyribonuclease VII small subunit [Ilumatobacteraceae bacterium]
MSDPQTDTHSDSQAVPAGYAQAVAELDAILADLERADVDVDVLALKVQRASFLITFCRDRIGSARLQIEQAVSDLSGD